MRLIAILDYIEKLYKLSELVEPMSVSRVTLVKRIQTVGSTHITLMGTTILASEVLKKVTYRND